MFLFDTFLKYRLGGREFSSEAEYLPGRHTGVRWLGLLETGLGMIYLSGSALAYHVPGPGRILTTTK